MNRILLCFALTGCAGMKLSMARSTVADQTRCPESQLNVWEAGEGWYVDGCGARYLCSVPQGPCAERLTDAQRLTRARATFSRETGCAVPDITVASSERGIIAQGCGRYSICMSHDGPCMPSRPPTCAEAAQERYDQCLNVARSDGKTGPYWFNGKYGAAAAVANTWIASQQGERMMQECRHRYDAELGLCPAPR